MCWAGKEAFVKALGTGFDGIGWKEVGVIREANGRPVLVFERKMKARIKTLGIGMSHISLSDDAGFISAYVILARPRCCRRPALCEVRPIATPRVFRHRAAFLRAPRSPPGAPPQHTVQ